MSNKCYERIQSTIQCYHRIQPILKLSESSVQTVLIREHFQRYHSKYDFMLSENSFQILLNVIRKFIQSAVRIQSKQHLSENPVETARKVNGELD